MTTDPRVAREMAHLFAACVPQPLTPGQQAILDAVPLREPGPGGLVTIIAGSREGVTLDDVTQAVQAAPWRPSVVVSGMAPGADRLGLRWASLNRVATVEKPAKWQRADGSTDRGAGHKRNTEMAAMAEALIAIWDGKSPGTNHMIQTALARGLRVYVYKPRSAR